MDGGIRCSSVLGSVLADGSGSGGRRERMKSMTVTIILAFGS